MKDAMSVTAVCRSIEIRISKGNVDTGHGGGGDASVGGSAGGMDVEANEAMS